MKIKLHEIPVREVVKGYIDSAENGVVGYSGRLNIRPAFQREFIYKDKQRDEVIRTVQKNFPLNVMYWVKSDNGNYELLDGQQRTISLCQYVNGDYSIDHMGFDNLTQTEREQILDYPLMIYICEGTDKEKLDWFKIINIAGEQLTAQELRNAIYTGEWLTEAKKYFSKTACPAYAIASDYLNGSPIRQNYLETAIKWIAARDGKEIDMDVTLAARPSSEEREQKAEVIAQNGKGNAWIGTYVKDITAEDIKSLNLPEGTEGALISQVTKDSPADDAELQVNDIIQKMDDQEIHNVDELKEELAKYLPGERITLTILRDNETIEVRLTLGTTVTR